MFQIEMLPAYHGDSLWIEWGDRRQPNRLLIDAGLAGTYDTIVNRAGARCSLELFCVTHVDQDHVEGAVKLLANLPRTLEIKQVWFNGWDQVSGAERLGAVAGEKLSAAILNHAKVPWNDSFHRRAVMVPPNGELPSFDFEGLTLTVLAPGKDELAALMPVWEKECAKAGLMPGDVDQAEAALEEDRVLRPRLGDAIDVQVLADEPYEPDDSETNGSSIALLAEFDGKALLLAGDAHAEVLAAGIRRLLAARGGKLLKVDAFKMCHHGSRYNNGLELIELLDCPRWLISTNGNRFHHPDRQTVARVLVAHRRDEKQLYFNYQSECNAVWDNDRLRKDWSYQACYPRSERGGIVVEL